MSTTVPPASPYCQVALKYPLDRLFSYKIPPQCKEQVAIGSRVLVPFRRHQLTGMVIRFTRQVPPGIKLRSIIKPLDESPIFNRPLLRLAEWIADYYLCPLGVVIDAMLPGGIGIKSKRFFYAGQGDLELSSLSEQERNFCLSLRFSNFRKSQKGYTAATLNQRFELSERQIKHLTKLGILRERIELVLPRVKDKHQLFFKPRKAPEEMKDLADQRAGHAPRQAEILKGLAGGPKARNHFPRIPLTVFKRLEKEGFIAGFQERVFRNPFQTEISEPPPPALFPEQKKILERIVPFIKSGRFQAFLLYGVTGSGKTEIYLKAVEEVLALGGQALVLVPEISLTPQLFNRFRARFEGKIALLHSALSDGERLDEWNRVRSGQAKIVVGTRSALFAPFDRLKLIVCDEEHDSSFKQENQPCYSGRDAAVVRARQSDCPIILGSATPSLESFYNTRIGKFERLDLPKRIFERPMPEVKLVDMRIASCLDRGRTISTVLAKVLENNLTLGEHSLLLLNRRGFHNFILCLDCGNSVECPSCSVSLTYHKVGNHLLCHYCGYTVRLPEQCSHCRSSNLRSHGSGTQQLTEIIRERFPQARILRMDRDTATSKFAYWEMYKKLKNDQVDILIGTQIIAKGLDLPGVTLVGVIAADNSLYQPDFRAAERTFSLLAQVAGRAGRGETPGRVYVQTFNPDHYSVKAAAAHDYQGFCQEEMGYRKALGYPPFERLINLKIKDESIDKGFCLARDIALEMKELSGNDYQVIGPAQAPLAKISGKYRWQVLLKGSDRRLMKRDLRESDILKKNQAVSLDIDPLNLL